MNMSEDRYIDPFSYPDSPNELEEKLAQAVEEVEVVYSVSSVNDSGIVDVKAVDGKICFFYTNFCAVEDLPKTWRGFECIYKPAFTQRFIS